MKKLKNWFKNKIAILTLAMYNVEKNSLSYTSELLNSETTQTKRYTQGKLVDSLINGEVTQEVMDLRWRTYKILRESEGVSAEIVDYDKDGMPIVKTKKINKSKVLNTIKLDNYDSYELEMVIDNSPIILGVNDVMVNEYIKENKTPEILSLDTASLGRITAEEYFGSNKTESPIKIDRDFISNFDIERYTKKLNIRKIDDKTRLLEFYVSKYPDPDNKTSYLFIKEIQKALKTPRQIVMLDISKVSFITYKCIGVSNFLEFEYKIKKFDKLIEFNGNYVIKFVAEITKNGEEIFEKYKMDELDKKYKNKEKK